MEYGDLFPQAEHFPSAIGDVARAPLDATSVRLISRATNFRMLEQMPGLQRLWCFGLNVARLAVISRLKSLRRLYVEGLSVTSVASLTALDCLELLSLEAGTRVETFSELQPLTRLRGLGLVHFPKVGSLEALRTLTALEALAVSGGQWSRMTVDTLAPLRDLTGLRHLSLANLKAQDESLAPLGDLANLQTLVLPNFYPMEEFARLAGRMRNTACMWFSPVNELSSSRCGSCGCASMVMLTGKRLPTLCSVCDEGRVKAHVERFRAHTESGARC